MMLRWRATCLVAMALQVWLTNAQYTYWEWDDIDPVRVLIERPVRIPIKEPVRGHIQEPVRGPIQEPVRVPIENPVRIPIKEPVRVSIEKPVRVPIHQPVRVSIQEPVRVPIQQPMRVPIQEPVWIPIEKPVWVPFQQPVWVPIEKPVRVPIEKPVRGQIQEPVRVPIEKPVRVPIEKPVRVPIEKAVWVPIHQPVRVSIQEPVRVPIQQPMRVPIQEPVWIPIEKPVWVPFQQPVRVPIEKPVRVPIEKPSRIPIQEPVRVPIEKPVRVPIKKPVRVPIQEPVKVPIEKPVRVPIEKPVRVPIEKPVRVPIEKPVRVPIEKPVRFPIKEPVRVPFEKPVRVPIQEPVRPVILPPPPSPLNCEVEYSLRINCGSELTNADKCEAMGCCFDGHNCFYGKAVTVQVTKDGQFVVVVAMDVTLPSLDLDSIHFLDANDPHCRPVGSNSGFAIYQFPVTACGSLVGEEFGIIIYENRMISSYVSVGPRGLITRDSHYELLFQGRYRGMHTETLLVSVLGPGLPPGFFAGGHINMELRLANGQCHTKGCVETEVAFSSFYIEAEYPVFKVLMDPVYVEVRMVDSSDHNIVLTLERCWATSSQEPYSMPQWDLIIDGCPYQADRYQTIRVPVGANSGLTHPTHHKRFILKMFAFVDDNNFLRNHLYIHCSTAMCNVATAPCVNYPQCFRRRRSAAVQRKSSGGAVVSSGAVILTEYSATSELG